MRNLINIVRHGVRNPRYYIESLNINWWILQLGMALVTLILAISTMLKVTPLIQQISTEMSEAIEYLPNYEIQNNVLQLEENSKPLYYEGSYFKLIIDDDLKRESLNQRALNEERPSTLKSTKFLSLFILQDDVTAVLNQQVITIPNGQYLVGNPHRLKLLLDYPQTNQISMFLSIVFSYFMMFFIRYWFDLILINGIAGLFNFRLTRPILWRDRLKIMTVISYAPVLLLEAVSWIFPLISSSFLILSTLCLVIFFICLRNHTQYIQFIMKTLDIDIDSVQDEIKRQMDELNQRENSNQKNKETDQKRSTDVVDLYPKNEDDPSDKDTDK